MSASTLRWGISATGKIAARFAADLEFAPGAELAAVASRTPERAAEFGDRFAIPNRHGSKEDLAADPSVDVVYVASPHTSHCADTLLFVEAGKHVLCEKPFAVNQREANLMIDAARRRGVFVMEAVWSRFLPAYGVVRELLADGRIGEPRLVESDFGFRAPRDPSGRLFDPALGGGGLLDLGIYPLQLALMVLGAPLGAVAAASIGPTGVDEEIYAIVTHEGGHSVSKAAVTFDLPNRARITGTDGAIELPPMMHMPDHVNLVVGDTTSVIETPRQGVGLWYEAAEVGRCIAAGEQQSEFMPWDETLRLVALMDDIRAQVGVRYPADG